MPIIVNSDLVIRCKKCKKINVFNKNSLDENVVCYDERPMGTEIEYDFSGEFYCDNCNNKISISINAFEYPEGAINDSNKNCFGGIFEKKPILDIEHYE